MSVALPGDAAAERRLTGCDFDVRGFAARLPSPLLDLEGAVFLTGEENETDGKNAPLVALHYGNPGAEERAMTTSRAFTDFSDREIVCVSGKDRLSWLQSLSTQFLENLSPGESRELLILSPQGHIENQAGILDDGETAWLICDKGYGQTMLDFLNSMRFMLDVIVHPCPDMGALAVYGDFPREVTDNAGARGWLIWQDAWARTSENGAHYGVLDDKHPASGFPPAQILICERGQLMNAARMCIDAGLRPAGSLASEAVRVRSWRPRMSFEGVLPKALPHELDWLRSAVHLHKGCYRGQETVAKIVNLGRPPRRLVYLYLEGEYGKLPDSGSDIMWNGRVCGNVTSAVRSTDEGAVALGVLRRAVPIEAILDVGDYRASQREIVACEGKSSVSPDVRPGAELRGRDLSLNSSILE